MFFRLAIAFVYATFCLYSQTADDSAVALARILASKGTITATDLSTVIAASPAGRINALAAILQNKGLLTTAEVAQLGMAPAAPKPAPRPVVAAAAAPAIPVTTTSRVPVSLYGTLVFNAFANTAAANIEDFPLFASKQSSDPTGGDKNFGATARQTRLGLRLNPVPLGGATLTGDFEFDLFGGKTPVSNGVDMDIFRVRTAYGRLSWKHAAFEAGQDWALFSPLSPTSYAAYAVAEFSASGNPWIRLPQVRGEFSTGSGDTNRLLFQFAALDPNMGDYPTAVFSTSRQPGIGERGRMPALESRIAYTARAAGRDFTLGLSGHYGHGRNYGLINNVGAFAKVDSWGVNLDYSLPVTRRFNLTGEAFEGRALGIFSVTSGEAIGAVGTPGAHGVESRGGWTQAQFNLAKPWQLNVAYGIEVPNASQLPVGNRWRNETYMTNIMYKLNPLVTFALEYRRLLTDYRNQLFANERGDHINLSIVYGF